MAYNFYSLTRISPDANDAQQQIDLFVQTWSKYDGRITFQVARHRHAMRLDLFCLDYLQRADYMDLVMKINDIQNPFSIRTGDIIFYPVATNLNNFHYLDPKLGQRQRDELLRDIEAQSPSPARKNFLQSKQKQQLPPNISTNRDPKIVVENNKIKLAPNNFSNPNDNTATAPINNIDAIGAQNQNLNDQPSQITVINNRPVRLVAAPEQITTERVLVDQFIRSQE